MKYGKGKKFRWLAPVLVILFVCAGIPCVSAEGINVPGDYSTIQAAIDNASAGDVITVSAGTYPEYITVGTTLTLQGYGYPVIQGDRDTNEDVVALNAENILFDGFEVTGSDSSHGAVGISGTGVVVRNCTVTENEGMGIYVHGATDAIIRDCLVTDNGFGGSDNEGVFLDAATNVTVERTTIAGSAANNIYMYSSTLCTIRENVISSGADWYESIAIRSGSSRNTIADNEIRDALKATGIYVYTSSGNTITGNTISNCSVEYGYGGVVVSSSPDTVCSGNVIENSGNRDVVTAGLYITGSDNTIIFSNTITGSGRNGLFIEDSKNATLTGNTLSDNYYNFGLTGSYDYHSHYDTHSIDASNTIDGRPISYHVGETGTTIGAASNAGTVYCINCDDVTVEDLTLSNTTYGVVLRGTTRATVSNVSVATCEHGIDLLSSDNTTISDLSVTDCYRGFNIRYATDNTITRSTVSDPSSWGMYQDQYSSGNTIFLNTFSGSSRDVYSAATDTLWNSPTTLVYYYLGTEQAPRHLGNHWADYTGTDDDSDGIGDTAFAISTDTDDACPLIAPHTAYTFAGNQPPSASFTWSPMFPNSTENTWFTDTSVDTDGTIASWNWDFGDAGTSTAEDPVHVYAAPGWYTVTLNVTDNLGAMGSASMSLFVHDPGPMTFWVPDNATTIQGGVDLARDGDTVMVRNGTYDENITVTKQLTLTGTGWPVINGAGKDNDTVRIQSDNVVFEGFEVRSAERAGIYIRENSNTVVRDNRVLDSEYWGIRVRGSDSATIFNSTVNNNSWSGICIEDSNGCIIHNNTCEFNGGNGIYLNSASDSVIYDNDLNNYNEGTGVFHNAAEDGSFPSTNLWYNESLLRGNRYSDYDGIDENGDGIGDTPYTIPGGEGGSINSDPYPLMPAGPAPVFPPTISAITVSGITADSATVRWTIGNGVESSSRVLYGTDSGLVGAVWSAWNNATTMPSFPLAGLAWNTTYYYQCYSQRSEDGDYNTTSDIGSFTTLRRVPKVITVDDDDGDIPVPPADFATITDAIAASMDGDTILVYAGNYSGYHEVATRVNLTGIGWPVVSGDQDNTFEELGDVFALRADGCILDGFVIRDGWWHNQSGYGTTTDSAGVRIGYLSVPADDTIVQNNRIEDSKYGIIANSGSNNNTIRYNVIDRNNHGVWINNARTTLFVNNTVTRVVYGALSNSYRISTTETYATNNRIEYNTFDDAGWAYGGGYDTSYGRGVGISGTGGNVIAHNILLNQTYLSIWGDGNIIEENQVIGPSGSWQPGIDIWHDGNIVRNNTVEGHLFGIQLGTSADNLQMSGNTITGCTYGFGFGGDIGYVSSRPARNVIDTTNTVEGAPVYWIVGAAGQVYNYSTLVPSPGYLALIGCSDIRVEDLYLEKNAQSFFIYRSRNVTLDSVSAHGNGLQGVLIGESDGVTIAGSSIDSNAYDSSYGGGICADDMTNGSISDTEVTGNDLLGVRLDNCVDTLIAGCTVTNNGGTGIRSDSDSSNLTVTGCTIGNTHATVQEIGIYNHVDDLLFYNNRFLNHTIAHAQNWGAGTRWNITPVAGTNVIGGPWIAGNYWEDYAGNDTNGDGLGDTLLPYTTGGATPGRDYHPLLATFVPDTTPPVIHISAPQEGRAYPAAAVPLAVSSPDADVAAWWYSLDMAANVTFAPNITLPAMSAGAHTLRVWASDTSGNENRTLVNFTAGTDTTPPVLIVTSPVENVTYTVRDIPLNVSSPDTDAFSWWYALDGGGNSTAISPDTNATLTGLANGNHTVAVFMDDIIGNTNTSTVNFSVNATVPVPTPVPDRDSGDDGPELPVSLLPVVEEPAFQVTILTPDAGQTVDRHAEVTYTATATLARAYYQLDDGPLVQVRPGSPVSIDRLTLGTHEITVTGIDTFGRYGQGSVRYEVIPLAIGEDEPLGTTAYPDDAVVSFTGRAVNYTLSFEVETASREAVSVYLNRRLAGTPGGDTSIVPVAGSGLLLENVSSPSGGAWTIVSVPVPAAGVLAGEENIISFIHTRNPERTDDLTAWHVRNVALVSNLSASAPSIRVYTPDQALGPGDEMMVWVDISGIAPEDRYTAKVYLVAPDGGIVSFPGGSGEAVPLDDAYVCSNHNGRLPGSLSFAATDPAGTYRLTATLEPEGSDQLVSLSSVPVFFSADPAVRLSLNRDILGDGMELRVMHAATGGTLAEEETLVILMEHPDGTTTSLPAGTESSASRHYAPLGPLFETILDETVDAGWDEGAYLIRSMLYNSTDTLVAQDIATFTVAREDGTLALSFPLSVTGGMPASSRIWLMDAVSLEIVAEKETGTAHDEVVFSVPAGTYWYGGDLTTGAGEVMIIPVDAANRVSIQPGETVLQRMVVQTMAAPVPTEVIP